MNNKSSQKWTILLSTIILMGAVACNNSASKTPTKPTMSIHEATFMGNVSAVKAHLAFGSDLNEKDEYGSTPLHVTAIFGKEEVAKILIEAGADLNSLSADGSTPLHSAALFCRTEIVKGLLDKGADVTIRNSYNSTALESMLAPFEIMKPVYDQLSKDLGPFGLKLDYQHLETTRPIIAEMIANSNQK